MELHSVLPRLAGVRVILEFCHTLYSICQQILLAVFVMSKIWPLLIISIAATLVQASNSFWLIFLSPLFPLSLFSTQYPKRSFENIRWCSKCNSLQWMTPSRFPSHCYLSNLISHYTLPLLQLHKPSSYINLLGTWWLAVTLHLPGIPFLQIVALPISSRGHLTPVSPSLVILSHYSRKPSFCFIFTSVLITMYRCFTYFPFL